MNWNDIYETLSDLCETLEEQEIPQINPSLDTFRDEHQILLRAQIDPGPVVLDALQTIVDDLPLPDLTPAERRLVWIRVHYATEFARALHTGPDALVPPPPANRRLLLTWLLFHVWEFTGFRTINVAIETLICVSGGNSRYFSRN